MKNYPNQATDLARIRTTLDVLAGLRDAGQDVADDGVLGYELARRHAYTFREFDYDAADRDGRLEHRITQEQGKRASNQGARTFAREMRRTFRDLGWLGDDLRLTDAGQAFVASKPGSPDEAVLLALALLDLEVDPGPSHPARILLKLLHLRPAVERRGLELALEAKDDTPAEFARVAALYQMSDDDRTDALETLGATTSQIANNRKIFPALARAAGLVVEQPARTYRLSPIGQALVASDFADTDLLQLVTVGPPTVPPGVAANVPSFVDAAPGETPAAAGERRRNLRAVGPDAIANTITDSTGRLLTDEEQVAARLALNARTSRHHRAVQRLAAMFDHSTGTLSEGAVDLLWTPHDNDASMLLYEVKTIDNDAATQIRYAVGQVLYYRYFDVQPLDPARAVTLAVAVDGLVDTDLSAYLDDLGIALLLVTQTGWRPLNAQATSHAVHLGDPESGTEPT